MGFLDYLEKRKERPSLGVCIPEHRQKSAQGQAGEQNPAPGTAQFRISGLYAVRGEVNIMGEVVSGEVKIGAKLAGIKDASVLEIHSEKGRVPVLRAGEHGMLFLGSANDALLKSGKTIGLSQR